MKDIKNIIETILQSTPRYEEKTYELKLFQNWSNAVGERIAKHTQPQRLTSDGVLFIATENSAWNHHLRFLEKQIIQKLHETIDPERTVKSLRFVVRTDPKSA